MDVDRDNSKRSNNNNQSPTPPHNLAADPENQTPIEEDDYVGT